MKTVMFTRLLVTMSCILHTNTPLCYLRLLSALVCMSIRLPMFSSSVCCYFQVHVMLQIEQELTPDSELDTNG